MEGYDPTRLLAERDRALDQRDAALRRATELETQLKITLIASEEMVKAVKDTLGELPPILRFMLDTRLQEIRKAASA